MTLKVIIMLCKRHITPAFEMRRGGGGGRGEGWAA